MEPAYAAGVAAQSSRPSEAGSIAARFRTLRGGSWRVIPPFRGGLHCGPPTATACAATRSCHPALQRRAPLRRVTRGHQQLLRVGHPALQRRAPLRRGHVVRDSRQPGQSSRPSEAGSIAAAPASPGTPSTGSVIPPFRGGLHCGGFTKHGLAVHARVIPPFRGGLHCGG